MKTTIEYLEEDLGIKVPETGTIDGTWFKDNGLPMVVSCVCCGTTMNLLSNNARVAEDGNIVCTSCI